jgi:hypothetical protein
MAGPAWTAAPPAVDRGKFLGDGFLVVPGLVGRAQLQQLRGQYETLVDRMRAADPSWDPAEHQGPGSPQPRLNLTTRPLSALVDASTIQAVEVWLPGGPVHRVSSALLGVKSASSMEMMVLCSPRAQGTEQVPSWHRDFSPPTSAPLELFARCAREACPRHVSWNIALYDDALFHLLPGSHLQRLDEERARLLDADPSRPCPGAVQAHLNAGDGVAKLTPVLHWAEKYSDSPFRRTVHGNYNIGDTENGQTRQDWLLLLSPAHQQYFSHHRERCAGLLDLQVGALRAVLAGDKVGFEAAVDAMHPEQVGGAGSRDYSTSLLHKAARQLAALHHPGAFVGPGMQSAADELAAAEQSVQAPQMQTGLDGLGRRFSAAEAAELWGRFGAVDALLRGTEAPVEAELADDHHRLREFVQKFGGSVAQPLRPAGYKFWSAPPPGALSSALFPPPPRM